MATSSGFRFEVVRYAVVYPGAVVVPLGALAVLRPAFGPILLIAAALLGGILFAVFGGDTRSEQVTAGNRNTDHFQRDVPERKGSGLTGSVMLFGIGLFVLAGLAFVLVAVV